MKTILFSILFLSLSMPVYAGSYIKCGGSIAHIGDELPDVELNLGSPDYAQEENVLYVSSGRERTFLEYYYICGSHLWCLKFDNDILVTIIDMGPEKHNREFIKRRFGDDY